MKNLVLIIVLFFLVGCTLPVTMALYEELEELGTYETRIENLTDKKVFVETGEHWWSGPVIFTLKGALVPVTLSMDAVIGLFIELPMMIHGRYFRNRN